MKNCIMRNKQLGGKVLESLGCYILHPNNIIHARHLYECLGFTCLGAISGGFRMKEGHYEDICPYYHKL